MREPIHKFDRKMILSVGGLETSCALQYILLHLLGYKLSLDDLKQFRQLDSLTPGHPEHGHTDG